MLWWIWQQLRVSSVSSRLAVVQKLAAAEQPAASLEPLLFALKDYAPEVRLAAAESLGKFQNREAVGPLLELLRDPVMEVRGATVLALGQLGDPLAIKPLVALLADPDQNVRGAVSEVLEKLGWQPGEGPQRVHQVLATGKVGKVAAMGTEAVGPLIDLMRSGTPDKQLEAVKALSQMSDARVKTAMLEALRKENPILRVAALSSLQQIGDETMLPALEKLLNDSNVNVRGAALDAVVSCGRIKAVPALLRMLKDSAWDIRQTSVKTLGNLRDPSAVDGIITLLSDVDRDVRESAVGALGKIGDRRAAPALVLATLDRETPVRNAAAAALRMVDRNWDKNSSIRLVLPKVKAALNHPEYWVRHSATRLFAQLKIDPETVTDGPEIVISTEPAHPAFAMLSDLLFDQDRDLRLAAVAAFRQLHERNALPLLGAAVHDADRNVQLAARQALTVLE